MNHRWIRRTDGAETVVIVFGGWAVGWAPFAHLEGPEDVLFVEDYRDLDHDLPDLSGYAQRWLLAYSLGVASFAHWVPDRALEFDRTLAVCGSLTPVDRRLGIPPQVYQATQDGLTQESFQAFLTLCFGTHQPKQQIDVKSRQDELAAIANRGLAPGYVFDQILIAERDRIWPASNLARAWVEQVEKVARIDAPHVLFDRWSRWKDLFGGTP